MQEDHNSRGVPHRSVRKHAMGFLGDSGNHSNGISCGEMLLIGGAAKNAEQQQVHPKSIHATGIVIYLTIRDGQV